jgi:hypothetical protein
VRLQRPFPAIVALIASLAVGLAAAALLAGASAALAANVAPAFTADNPPEFRFAVAYGDEENSCGEGCSYNEQDGYAFSASGSPAPTYSVSSGALPAGLYLDPANGLLYGFPSSPDQAYSFSVSASNGVAPSAVAGPFSGHVSKAGSEMKSGESCAPGAPPANSEGSETTTTTSTAEVTSSAVDVSFPNVPAVATRVLGRVIENGTPRVVYEQQAPVAASEPQAQALFADAANADSSSAPGASVAAPALASTASTTSAPTQVGQIVPGPASSTKISFAGTVTVGPKTIGIADLETCRFKVQPGSEDINGVVNYEVAAATDEFQATETTTSTYYVDATVPGPAVSTTPLVALAPLPASSPIATAASALALGCSGARIELTNVHEQGSHVVLEGAAVSSLVGSQVKLLFSSGKQVASTTVASDGFFSASAPLPPLRIRDTNAATYSAMIGSAHSASLKLTRRLSVTAVTVAGRSVHFSGTVRPPLAIPTAPVLVKVSTSCTATPQLISSVKPSKSGSFVVTASIPPGADAAIFTLESRVRPEVRTRRKVPTFSLPQTVQAG